MAADDEAEVDSRLRARSEERRSRRRGVTFLLGFALLLAVVGLWVVVRQTDGDTWKGCPADGRLGPNGEVYGRSPEKGCQFVDGDGNVVDLNTVQVGNG